MQGFQRPTLLHQSSGQIVEQFGVCRTVTQLAEDLGFEVADVGPLTAARFLEPLAIVWIRLASVQGWGRNMAFKIVKR